MFGMKDRDLLSALNNPIQQSLMFGSRCLPLMDSCPAARQVFGIMKCKRISLGGIPSRFRENKIGKNIFFMANRGYVLFI